MTRRSPYPKGPGLAAGAGWVLFLTEIPTNRFYITLVLAATWGLAAAALTVLPQVSRFLRMRREEVYRHRLGPLHSADDAARWIAVLSAWRSARLTTGREHRRVADILKDWLDSNTDRIPPHDLEDLRARLQIDL